MSDEQVTNTNSKLALTPEEAVEMLWRRGNLAFKLDPYQQDLKNVYVKTNEKIVVWACSRRLGKTWSLLNIAIELCLNKKNAVVKFLAPTKQDVKKLIRAEMRKIIADAPKDIAPYEMKSEGSWMFPSTGAQIQFAGCDGGSAESVRGSNADLCIVDEAGFVKSDLEYIVNSILLPTTSLTKGKILLASTPPKSFDHDFRKFVNIARASGSYIHKTVYENTRLPPEELQKIIESCGGVTSIAFRREYMAEFLTDTERAIVPEFTQELQAKIVKEWPRPPFYDTYSAMDVGMKDLTVVLFAYFDFKANKLIIEDEFVINGQKFTTDVLASNIREKEAFNFTDKITGEQKEPYKRVSDNNLLLIQDLYRLHGIIFQPTKKDDADLALNNMRMLLKDGNIIIHPRCKTLISHLDSGTWNKAKTSFDRSGDKGHYDAIDSLKYLVRNIDFNKNPYPIGWSLFKPESTMNIVNNVTTATGEAWKRILKIK